MSDRLNAVELTKALKGKWFGRYGMACCPAHDDHNPSLSICDKNGKTLVCCQAGCDQRSVITALQAMGLWGNGTPQRESIPEKSENANGEHAMRIWDECVPASGTLVEIYLMARAITIPIPDVLRFHPRPAEQR